VAVGASSSGSGSGGGSRKGGGTSKLIRRQADVVGSTSMSTSSKRAAKPRHSAPVLDGDEWSVDDVEALHLHLLPHLWGIVLSVAGFTHLCSLRVGRRPL
jgi:hypothetical protein